MKYLHTMVRVSDLAQSLAFYCDALGLRELRRHDSDAGRYTLVFLAAPGDDDAQVELTYNWDPEPYGIGRAFGHLAYAVDDIYAACQRLMERGVTINRPPRDGRMAFVRSPDSISVELLQKGAPLPPREPWTSMPTLAAGERPGAAIAAHFQSTGSIRGRRTPGRRCGAPERAPHRIAP